MQHPLLCLRLVLALGLMPLATAFASDSTQVVSASPSSLPPLPRLEPIALPEPDPVAVNELDRILQQTCSSDAPSRQAAQALLKEPVPKIVPAIHLRVQEIRGSLDRDAAPRILGDARKVGRKAKKAQQEEKKSKADKDDNDGDWLDFMLAMPRPKSDTWCDVVKLLTMVRLLAADASTPAVRELIALHSYFGELLRIDLQRQISLLRDKSIAALIEARQHDAKIVQRWANKQLDLLGKAIPGEAVSTNDTQILVDVLRAYGRTRDVDAVRVILSFCNSDRIRIRDAAREALAAVGEPALWQLRDVYLNLTGNKPPRDWAWDRIAQELFVTYDRARLAEVYQLMDDGMAAANAGKFTEATSAFDKVLARTPLFERRKEMVPAYVEQAKSLVGSHVNEALAMMRKALRLDPQGPKAKMIEAEIAYLEGLISIEEGNPDRFAFKRAITLDPSHTKANEVLASLQDTVIVEQKRSIYRYVGAGSLGSAALVAMFLLIRRRKPSSKADNRGSEEADLQQPIPKDSEPPDSQPSEPAAQAPQTEPATQAPQNDDPSSQA